ncbi:hypothetical protein AN189_17640 [Loktanella sp. 3ANDIMAR09]|uniref:hypothetical protein n=1 Tax=Loktanella sp. 3ANDIMAR09 TaxID=1225657 RepID=UPI000700151B|nr:hypothetical protein [Loktanella sp. 3ANDIMAR09]KQI67046.1 hypothetical protein AN189_17640 [Loktanella sp. 3ANDIMAR09]
MTDVVRIVPPGPGLRAGHGTKVFCGETEIGGITSVCINIQSDSIITATVEVAVTLDEVWAHPLLGRESLERAAKAYGLKLTEE